MWELFFKKRRKKFAQEQRRADPRVRFVVVIFGSVGALIILKLFNLQVLQHDFYYALASDQHEIFQQLFPERGGIYVRDSIVVGGNNESQLYPLAINKDYNLVFAQPKYVEDARAAAGALAPILQLPEDELFGRLDKPGDPYEPLASKVEDYVVEQIDALEIPGIRHTSESYRYYPEQSLGAHVIGFLGNKGDIKTGLYGIEGYFNDELSGIQGAVTSEKDIRGRWISIGDKNFKKAVDGSDIILTIDRSLQAQVCQILEEEREKYAAKTATVIIVNPETGAIKAMCSSPTFDPNNYNQVEDISVYNNTSIYGAYEPGSIFKLITMAAALDMGLVTPETTYVDEGEVEIDDFTVRNSDRKAHGVQTMTDVLDKSLNLGTIWISNQLGTKNFRKYVEAFGFGEKTGIELETESKGNIESLSRKGDIFRATASFGQGITVTPLQMLTAVNAIANGGKRVDPYIVEEIRRPNGERIPHTPSKVSQVIQSKTATILGGMMTSVIENGQAWRAGVPGYYLAGKTGTAQIADTVGGGYSATRTNQSFVGFGPLENPKFTMIVKLEEPANASFASVSAASVFGRIAQFILDYYKIPPTR